MKRRRPQVAGGYKSDDDDNRRSGGSCNRSPIKILSQSQARGLFDEIAPHLPLALLRAMCNFFKRKKKLASKEGSFGSKLDTLWQNEPDRRKIPPKWVKDMLRQALITGLVGQKNSSSTKKTTYRNTKDEAGYAPQVNRQNWEKNVNVLMQVRELWVDFQPSEKKKKKSESKIADASSTPENEMQTEKRILHQGKTTQKLRAEAETLLNHLADRLPSDDFRKFAENITDFHNTAASATSNTIRISPIMAQALFWNSTKTHVQLVIYEMASFFYVDLTTDIQTRMSKNLMAKSIKQWDELRERSSMTLPAFQQTVLKRKPASKKEQVEEAIGDFDLNLHKKNTVELAEGKGEGEAVVEKKERPKKRRPYHVRLDAMLLTDDTPSIPHADKMMLIDNLPIDISEMELFDLYLRCGSIQSVSIFNQRPDMDPGAYL